MGNAFPIFQKTAASKSKSRTVENTSLLELVLALRLVVRLVLLALLVDKYSLSGLACVVPWLSYQSDGHK